MLGSRTSSRGWAPPRGRGAECSEAALTLKHGTQWEKAKAFSCAVTGVPSVAVGLIELWRNSRIADLRRILSA